MKKVKLMGIVVGFVSGVLFGIGMIVSGMADPKIVTAFLDITGDWDPSLAFVMAGALIVFIPCYHLIIKKRAKAVSGSDFSLPSKTRIDGMLISGAVIFGIGWGISGICPGPAMSSVSGGSNVILAFVLSMLTGMIIANQYMLGRIHLPFIVGHKNNSDNNEDDDLQTIESPTN